MAAMGGAEIFPTLSFDLLARKRMMMVILLSSGIYIPMYHICIILPVAIDIEKGKDILYAEEQKFINPFIAI